MLAKYFSIKIRVKHFLNLKEKNKNAHPGVDDFEKRYKVLFKILSGQKLADYY